MPVDLIAFRRDLHANPETGTELPRTAANVADMLKAAGLEVTHGVGGHGVVATLQRGSDNDAIGFRADMDALPITEDTGLPYQSRNSGVFHGCGHDGHTTMLLGAALALAEDAASRHAIRINRNIVTPEQPRPSRWSRWSKSRTRAATSC